MTAVEEYYAIRIVRKEQGNDDETHSRHDIFITDSNKLGHITKAKRFASIEAAETFIRQHPVPEQYQHHIQLCITENRNSEETEQSRITARLMEIPYPYRRTAYNWMRGKDVIGLLRSESDEVYERHHAVLLDYDIDISQPSSVLLLSAKKKPKTKPHYDALPDNAPRQFVASPQQRPSAKPKQDKQD